jgi:hypothetical protein
MKLKMKYINAISKYELLAVNDPRKKINRETKLVKEFKKTILAKIFF